jgi:hypothetical protein
MVTIGGDKLTSKSLGVITSENDIIEIRPISKNEYNEFNESNANLMIISKKLELFKLVYFNFKDYTFKRKNYRYKVIRNPSIISVMMEDMILTYNLAIVNYLSSIKTFLDHSEYELKKKCGKNSPQYLNFKNSCSVRYDTYFEYRFLIKLRNYVQHCGLPITKHQIVSEQINNDPIKFQHHLILQLNRDEILEKFNWKKLKPEIEKLPQYIDIDPYMLIMNKCIAEITFMLYKNDMMKAIESTKFLISLINETREHKGTPFILDKKRLKTRGIGLEGFLLQLIEIINYLSNFQEDIQES